MEKIGRFETPSSHWKIRRQKHAIVQGGGPDHADLNLESKARPILRQNVIMTCGMKARRYHVSEGKYIAIQTGLEIR